MKEKTEGLSDFVMMESPLLSINLFSSKNIHIIQRKYQNFGELLASIGGLINILVIVGIFDHKSAKSTSNAESHHE